MTKPLIVVLEVYVDGLTIEPRLPVLMKVIKFVVNPGNTCPRVALGAKGVFTMLTSARFVFPNVGVTVTTLEITSGSVTVTVNKFVPLSSLIVFEVMAANRGASFTGNISRLNVFVTESLPPLATPPLSFITTVMTVLP